MEGRLCYELRKIIIVFKIFVIRLRMEILINNFNVQMFKLKVISNFNFQKKFMFPLKYKN